MLVRSGLPRTIQKCFRLITNNCWLAAREHFDMQTIHWIECRAAQPLSVRKSFQWIWNVTFASLLSFLLFKSICFSRSPSASPPLVSVHVFALWKCHASVCVCVCGIPFVFLYGNRIEMAMPSASHSSQTPCNVNCISNGSQRMHNLSGQIIHMLGLFRYRPASPSPSSSPPLPLPLSPLIWLLFAILTDYLFVCLYSRHADIMCIENFCYYYVRLLCMGGCVCVCAGARVCVSMYI